MTQFLHHVDASESEIRESERRVQDPMRSLREESGLSLASALLILT